MPLKHLQLRGNNRLTDYPNLPYLRGSPLTSLDVSCCVEDGDGEEEVWGTLTDVELQSLRGKRLTLLHIGRSPKITDVGLQALYGMPLRDLDLRFSNITDDGLGVLFGMPLSNLSGCGMITDRGMQYLQFARFSVLKVGPSEHITGHGLRAAIRSDAPLTRLSVRGCIRLDDSDLLFLRGFTHLKRLDIEGCNFSSVGMQSFWEFRYRELARKIDTFASGLEARRKEIVRLAL